MTQVLILNIFTNQPGRKIAYQHLIPITIFDTTFSFLNAALAKNVATKLCTSWAMSTYSFQYFKSKPSSAGNSGTTIVWPDEVSTVTLTLTCRMFLKYSPEKCSPYFHTICQHLKVKIWMLFYLKCSVIGGMC